MHSLLLRQLKRSSISEEDIDPQYQLLLQLISEAYSSFDEDRELLEHSMELSSKELLQANFEMRALLAAVPDVFIWLNGHDQISRVQTTNTTHFALLDRAVVGTTFSEILEPKAGQHLAHALRRLKKKGTPITLELGITEGKEELTYEVRLFPLVLKQALVVLRNVTERKREEEHRLCNSKLDSVGLLAGGIAHDFNNILAAVLGNASVALLDAQAGSELAELMEEVKVATTRAQSLTQQLLTFSKGGAPVKTTASIHELIVESAKFCLRGSNVGCRYELDNDLWPVEVDLGQMSQVLNNLIINADQAMDSGGMMVIRATNLENPPPSSTAIFLDKSYASYVRIEVEDFGVGMTDEQLQKVFDPYFTTKPNGNGLGLATSFAIVRNHGGALHAESTPGEGTKMVFTLPAAHHRTSAVATLQSVPPLSSRSRVLIMDDDVHIRRSVSRMLNRLGFESAVARDGHEALEAYRLSLGTTEQFSMVIMDLTIPGGMGGVETMSRLKQLDPTAKAIVSSGYSSDFNLDRYQEHGFVDILPKPFDVEALAQALGRVRRLPL